MATAVWKFERSVEKTVEELRDVLDREGGVAAADVKSEWTYRAQLLIEPAGWEALWKLPQKMCTAQNIRFPCVVYVVVNSIDVELSLDAEVEIIGVQDESVSLPRINTVPLEQLWPLKNQSEDIIDVKNTANFIDLYRYFYTYIWLPWELDSDEAESPNWFRRHVPSRCKMWSNAYSGRGCSPMVLKGLLSEAKEIQEKIQNLEDDLDSDTEETEFDCNSTRAGELMKLHNRLEYVKLKWETYMNSTLKSDESELSGGDAKTSKNIVVWTGGQLNHCVEFLKIVEEWLRKYKNMSGDVQIECSNSLKECSMSKLAFGSMIFLCPGDHELPPIDAWISNDCNVISPNKNAVLECSVERAAAIVSFNRLSLTNITLNTLSTITGLAIRGNPNVFTDCNFKGPESKIAQGCVAYKNSKAIFKNCKIRGFFTGIVAHAESEVELDGCIFENCDVAIEIYLDAKITINNCVFNGYKESAIRYDNSEAKESIKGDASLLKDITNINLTNCTFSSQNDISDVFIAPFNECALTEMETE